MSDTMEPRTYSRSDYYKAWHKDWDKERRALISTLMRVYNNDWDELLKLYIVERFTEQASEKLKRRIDTTINLLRWVVDEKAAIYSQPAIRTLNGAPDGLEPYENNGLLDHFLDQGAKMCELCREVAIRPLEYNGSVILDIVTPDRFTVIPSPDNPLVMDAIIVRKKGNKNKFTVWTNDSYYVADNQLHPIGGKGDIKPNPYGRIPYVVAHARFPALDFFNHADAVGLLDATFQAGVSKTEHSHLRHYQSFKQLVISGTDDEKIGRMMSDPSSGLLLKNPQASANVIDMQADLQTHLETMFQAQRPTLAMHGIWADAVRGKMDANSGYALSLKMYKQQTEWQKMRVTWRMVEKELLDLSRIVLAKDAGVLIPEGDLYVDYAEIGPKSDPQERATLAESYKRLGMSRANIWREVFGKSEEWIAQNEMELAEQARRDDPIAVPILQPTVPGIDGDPATVDTLTEEEVVDA